jgi:glucose-1-phosphate cytidylyltransferase
MLPTVVILCGGRGTRLQERTHAIPKALVEIGGRPILWHVMQLYASQGFGDFVLYTGQDTPTGGRIALVADHLDDETFCATYADGVADLDLHALLRFHEAHGALATMTVVRPRLPFGVTELNGDSLVTGFHEKPRSEHWINGGFFCLEPAVLERLREDSVLEREPLESLAADGELRAYRHEGFWDCMDTYKDAVLLNDLWHSGAAPWRTWA